MVVYSSDVGNKDGNGNTFIIQALVNGEYVNVGEGFTCADGRNYTTAYAITPVTTTEIRLLINNTSIYMPTVLELEVYSSTEKPAPFVGHTITEKVPDVTVFKTETPRFEIAGLPR